MIAPCEHHRPGPAARQAARLGGRLPVLDTRRLQLRGPRIYDFEPFAAILCSDRAIHMGGPMTREEAWAEFTDHTACWLLHGHGLWTIDAQSTPAAGFVTLGFEYADPEAELGVFLGAEAEGQGLALEALTAARAHVFETLDWPSVVSYVGADNLRALRLMRRLGARRDPQAEAAIGDATLRVFRHHREAA